MTLILMEDMKTREVKVYDDLYLIKENWTMIKRIIIVNLPLPFKIKIQKKQDIMYLI